MANEPDLTDHQKKLRLCLYACGALGTVFGICWWLEIINTQVAQVLTGAFLLSTALLIGRISDISIRRAKDRKTAAKVTEDSIG